MDTKYDVMYYINDIRHKIAPAYDGDKILCQQYAWWILQAICRMTKTELIMNDTVMLSHEQQEQLDHWIHQLVEEHMPLQYLIGSVPFADCDILVQPPTLIPRPETEEWCLHIIEHLQLLDHRKIKILDLATGSGCIAIALAHHLPLAEIVATDIADSALALTEKNIEHHKLMNITCIKSDLFASIPQGMFFDIIVSNPPYISQDEFTHLDASVSHWEDPNALMADDDGLAIIKQIIVQASQFIQANNELKNKDIPQVVIEIGYAQGAAVKDLMKSAGYNDILVHKDLEGKDRFVTGRVDNVANFTLARKFVAISFTPDSLACCWIEKVTNGSAPLGVRAYQRYPFDNLELEHLTLFNPTIIKKYITSFLREHDLSDAFVAFTLHGEAVIEQFVAMPTSTPHRADFNIPNARTMMWEYRYLYPNHDGQFIFYVYSVPRSVVLQYKLLAIAAQCNLITMTTQTMALLSAYQHMFGSAFRRSQLAVDMMRCNNNIGDIITMDALRRMMNIGALGLPERLNCIAAVGLFCSERFE